jgi:hypothetical protein
MVSLDYQDHLKLYEVAAYSDASPETRAYFQQQAQETHALCIQDALLDIHTEIAIICQTLTDVRARYHLLFGACRRTRIMWDGFRSLHSVCPPDRKAPLDTDEATTAARALNDIYIHMKGAIDNYAWAAISLFGNEKAKSLKEKEVGLFYKTFKNNDSLKDIYAIAEPFLEWDSEIKERRDPVAHRIPLSVPPAILTTEDERLLAAANSKAAKSHSAFLQLVRDGAPQHDIDAAHARAMTDMAESGKVGTFWPVVVHDPDVAPIPMYPTVPADIGKFVELCRKLNETIRARIAEG